MNIEKLARHLKDFTLNEIEMIAECDCKTELELLLNEGKLSLNKVCINMLRKKMLLNMGFFQRKKIIISN